jgi:hypothetical protein
MFIEIIQQESNYEQIYGQTITEEIISFESRVNHSLETFIEVGRTILDINFLIQNDLITAIIKFK